MCVHSHTHRRNPNPNKTDPDQIGDRNALSRAYKPSRAGVCLDVVGGSARGLRRGRDSFQQRQLVSNFRNDDHLLLGSRPLAVKRCLHCMLYWSFIRVQPTLSPATPTAVSPTQLIDAPTSLAPAFVHHSAFIVVADRIERRQLWSWLDKDATVHEHRRIGHSSEPAGCRRAGTGSKSADQSWKSSE